MYELSRAELTHRDAIARSTHFEVEVHDTGASGVAYVSKQRFRGDNGAFSQARVRALEVPVNDEVVAQRARFGHGVQRNDARAEQLAHVEHFRITALMLEVYAVYRCASRRRQIEPAVTDGLEARAASLFGVGPIQVVAAAQEGLRFRNWDGQRILAIVGGSLRAARDVLVAHQPTMPVVVLVLSDFGRVTLDITRKRDGDAGAMVWQRARGTLRDIALLARG